MNNDRKIIISVGTNRRDLNWRQTALSVSELYDRLRNPIKSTENSRFSCQKVLLVDIW